MNAKLVLLVEDNPDDVQLTQHAFKKLDPGIILEVISDGVEALDYLYSRGKYLNKRPVPQPSLILLDLKMPRINGMEVLEQIKSSSLTKFIPVVILTSSKEEQDIFDSYSLHANSYIRKPIDFVEFTRTVGIIAEYWLKLNNAPTLTEQF